ncbi:TadE/TadG family type IV pilus assembly protein [Pelagibacterium montanilacus]|uniref:TadE/TadG family type IV pilus assembly protein n=1 Tax=Pelagibacterium montanilacus TaxID=2185280 RepID=UPI0013E08F2A|nr:TadE family protein [Pelagibacterium montanilacus]
MVRLNALARDTRGAAAVEFALLIAPFLLIVFGTIEVARAYWTREALHDVATATARCIGVGQLECGAEGFSLADSRSFAIATAAGRAVSLDTDTMRLETGVECDGLPNAVAVELQASFASVFPLDMAIDFTANACFVDWSTV